MATLLFKFVFYDNASPQVVLTSTELTGGDAPTVNISTTAIADGTVASAVSGGALTYDTYTKSWGYRLASADLATYLYIGMATTTYATASPASVHSLGMVIPDILPSTLATPAQVATELATYDGPTDTEMLAAFAALNDITAAEVWAAATRTLTQSAASVAAVVSGSNITAQRGDSLSISLTGLGDISTRTKLWFTVKTGTTVADTASTVQIEETAGLLYLNGAAGTSGNGVITVTDAATGALTITLQEADTANLTIGDYVYDVQVLTAAGAVSTLTAGIFIVSADVTRSIT